MMSRSVLFVAVALGSAVAIDIPKEISEVNNLDNLTTPLPTIAKYPTLYNRVQTDADFASLPTGVQRAVLWDVGLVRLGDSTKYTQIYTQCTRTMNDIFATTQSFDESRCEIQQTCKDGVQAFADQSCEPAAVVEQAICAVIDDDGMPEWNNITMYSKEPAELTFGFDPVIYAHSMDDSDNQTTMVYMITQFRSTSLENLGEADNSCLQQNMFVVPCRKISSSEIVKANALWCEPERLLGVTLWQQSVNTTTTDSDSSSGVSSTVAIILGIVAGVMALLAIVFLVLWQRSMHRPRSGSQGFYVESATNPNGSAQASTRPSGMTSGAYNSTTSARPSMSVAQIDAINEKYRQKSAVLTAFCSDQELTLKQISFSGIIFRQKLASGANGEVWQGEYEGQAVAIKRVMLTNDGQRKPNGSTSVSGGSVPVVDVDIKALEQFTQEIRIASTLDHINIVRFVGLAWRTLPELSMVSEFMASGDLARLLASPDSKDLTWSHKISLAVDISNALVYLHSLQPAIIHRDLKSLNVLLNEEFQAKLSDFGLSREHDMEVTMTSGVGTVLWTAPEVLRGEKYSEKADIYSFGVVLSELDTNLPPYSLNKEAQGIRGSKSLHLMPLITKGQITPEFRPDCPPAVLTLAKACLSADPSQRPNASQIVYELRSKIWPTIG